MKSCALLEREYVRIPDPVKVEGRAWYPQAWETCRELAKLAPLGIGPVRVAGVVATLSPRMRWSDNVRVATDAVVAAAKAESAGPRAQAYRIRVASAIAFPRRREKAVEILVYRAHPSDWSLGPKCDAFWRAIAGDVDQVVIDSWMAKILGVPQSKLTPNVIAEAQRRVTHAAGVVGETPRDLQSILWVNARGGSH